MANSSRESSRESSPDSPSKLLPPWASPPETAEARGKRLKSEPEPEPEMHDPMKMTYEEVKAVYEDFSKPYWVITPDFEYKNKAQIEVDEAITEYREKLRGLGPFDKLPRVPRNAGLVGGIYAHPITDANRPHLVDLSKVALDKYNADNKGANFVFAELVWTNKSVVDGQMYYFTFEAKDAADGTTHTFQAKVWDRRCGMGEEVKMCRKKPSGGEDVSEET